MVLLFELLCTIFLLESYLVIQCYDNLLLSFLPVGLAIYVINKLSFYISKNFKLAGTVRNLIIHTVMVLMEYPLLQEDANLCTILTVSSSVKQVYQLQICIWLCEGVISATTEEPDQRKDHLVLFAHHIITIALLVCSDFLQLNATGLLILFYHDSTDIFIDLLKIMNYLGYDVLVYLVYAINFAFWVYTRLYQFVIDAIIPCSRGCFGGERLLCALDFGLVILYFMHLFWTYLLVRVATRLINGETPKSAGAKEYEHTE